MSAYCLKCDKNHSVDINTHENHLTRCTCGASCHSDCGCTVEVICSDCKTRYRELHRESTASRKWRKRTNNGNCKSEGCYIMLKKSIYKKQQGFCLKCWARVPIDNRPHKINYLITNNCFVGH